MTKIKMSSMLMAVTMLAMSCSLDASHGQEGKNAGATYAMLC